MATRIYAIAPGAVDTTVVEGVGSAASSAAINITIDLGTGVVGEGTGTRVISHEEALLGVTYIMQHILRGDWPPAY